MIESNESSSSGKNGTLGADFREVNLEHSFLAAAVDHDVRGWRRTIDHVPTWIYLENPETQQCFPPCVGAATSLLGNACWRRCANSAHHLANHVGPIPYVQLQHILDPRAPSGEALPKFQQLGRWQRRGERGPGSCSAPHCASPSHRFRGLIIGG
jgi:hypothetical protein